LSREQRAQALLELGQDYMRAGLFDRAENLFIELTELKLFNEQAYIFLLEIYQQEKEWKRCLDVAEKISQTHYPLLRNSIAHFYCELAEQMLTQQNISAAEGYLKRAQQVQRTNVRALLLQAEIDYTRSDYRSVVKLLRQVEENDPIYLSEVLPRLVECHRKLGRQHELFEYLQQLYQRHHCTDVMIILSEMIMEKEGGGAAVDAMLRHLEEMPDLRGLERLVRLNLQRSEDSPKEALEVLLVSVTKLLEKQPAYQCDHCGFTAKKLHWHCPSCKRWGEIKPQQGLTRSYKANAVT
jgi:lipopolysaccharide biosynthesis regulator YciM